MNSRSRLIIRGPTTGASKTHFHAITGGITVYIWIVWSLETQIDRQEVAYPKSSSQTPKSNRTNGPNIESFSTFVMTRFDLASHRISPTYNPARDACSHCMAVYMGLCYGNFPFAVLSVVVRVWSWRSVKIKQWRFFLPRLSFGRYISSIILLEFRNPWNKPLCISIYPWKNIYYTNAHVSIPKRLFIPCPDVIYIHLSTDITLPTYEKKLTKPRKLEGSCQCGGIQFTLDSHTPVPYQLCACSICRKVGGYSGSVNLGGIADSLKVIKGKELIK